MAVGRDSVFTAGTQVAYRLTGKPERHLSVLPLGPVPTVSVPSADGLQGALDELQEISPGIHPAILARGGLAAALKAVARRQVVHVELEVHAQIRLPAPVEVAAYYVVSETLTNTAKHAGPYHPSGNCARAPRPTAAS
jgi:signal transduction histidine kinase